MVNSRSTIHTTDHTQIVTSNRLNLKDFVTNSDEGSFKESSCISQSQGSISSSVRCTFVNGRCSSRVDERLNIVTSRNSRCRRTIHTTSNSQCVVSSVNTTNVDRNNLSTSISRSVTSHQESILSKTSVTRYLNTCSTRCYVCHVKSQSARGVIKRTNSTSQSRSTTSNSLTCHHQTNKVIYVGFSREKFLNFNVSHHGSSILEYVKEFCSCTASRYNISTRSCISKCNTRSDFQLVS